MKKTYQFDKSFAPQVGFEPTYDKDLESSAKPTQL